VRLTPAGARTTLLPRGGARAVEVPWVAPDGTRLVARLDARWVEVDLAAGVVRPLPGPTLALLPGDAALLPAGDDGWPAVRDAGGAVRSLRPE
jgi:hypothetical protein